MADIADINDNIYKTTSEFDVMTNHKLITAENIGNGYYVITVRHSPNGIGRLLGAKTREVRYQGQLSIWYEVPKLKRCSNRMEDILSNYLKEIKFSERQELLN